MSWKPLKFELTPEQELAVNYDEGPILVVAGAGTGKTTVLSSRVVRLIEDKVAEPAEILAVSYTRNSARDLLKRIALLWKGSDSLESMGEVADAGLQVGTFHSYCYALLREAGQRFGLIDDQDLYVLLRRRIEELKLHYYVKAATPGQFLRDLTDFFKRCHDELRTPDDYDAYVRKLEAKQIPLPRVGHSKDAAAMPEEEILGRCHEIARVFRYVEEMLAAENLGTYSHVITRAIALLRDPRNSAQLERARKRTRFVLIDEFQDSNVAQIDLARLLAGDKCNIFAVGDPDQAIYRFRGATAGTFDHFLRTFGAERVKRVTMSQNRRSTEPVLKSAYSIISCNPQIASVELPGGEKWERQPLQHKRPTKEPEPVSAVLVRGWESTDSEATFVAGEIARMQMAGSRAWRDFAVLYRNHKHRDELVEHLLERGIPFAVTGVDLLQTPEVRDLLAGLRALIGGDPVSLLRVAALPQFNLSGEELRDRLAESAENAQLESSLERTAGGLQVITMLLEARRDVQRLQSKALAACGIAQRYFDIPHSRNTEAFTKFVQVWGNKPRQICGDGTLSEFLDYLEYFIEAGGCIAEPEDSEDNTPATLQMEMGRSPKSSKRDDVVQLLTVHAAKGLEFPVVFVLRVTQPSFPSRYREDLVEFPDELRDPDSRLNEEPKQVHAQEERRLFYVSVTRAEDLLYLCAKKGSGKDPTPPGYLRELVTAGKKAIPGCVEFGVVPTTDVVEEIHASAAPRSRITEWVTLPAIAQTTKRKLSASAIESYGRCPLSYKLALEWKLPEEPAANLQFGSAMHLTLLAYFDSVRKGRPMPPDDVVSYFLDEFKKAKIDDPTQRRLYERDGPRQLRSFLQSPAAQPHGQVALLEHTFDCELGGTRVIGRIDRIDEDSDGYVIVDYKTGNPKSQESADNSLQLSIYAMAMGKKKPVKLLVFENLENNSTVTTLRGPEVLRETETKIAEVAAGIAAGEFEATPGRHCNWCAYRAICPAMEVSLRSPNGDGESAARKG